MGQDRVVLLPDQQDRVVHLPDQQDRVVHLPDQQDRVVHFPDQQQHQPEEQNLADKQLEVVREEENVKNTKSNDEQKEIDELFDVKNADIQDVLILKEEVRSQSGNNMNHIDDNAVKFEHFQPVVQESKTKDEPKVQSTSSVILSRQVPPIPAKPGRLAVLTGNQRQTPSSLRELRRKQKRLNIRRLNFDPRR